ncbi:E3 ubiquitin-protein ligase Os04g0590900-like [Phoenix dactylifera]|uniref:RING-type E3 ubiquitin transferase n=1 Tax=Phoenix dactylifera TaxID=42345 RepID=A0A8B7BVL5_PHODC|nr:E3 ubiquitin-protein ligase Os04g0590900-like [Phoenix dactylifera]
MAAVGDQQTWVPYEPIKDCTQGLCTIYCPQWCYLIFPPPPAVELSDDSSGPTFSPLVIAIIGILASAFLLVSYYTIISKYCGAFDSLRRRLQGPGADDRELEDGLAQSHRHEAWQLSPSNGLDEALIDKIAVCKYRRGDGLVDGTDCSVCLSEFREDDSLRLLPKCNHAFHVQCIDTWLKSHSNCPLCRANIVSVSSLSPAPPLPAPPEPENASPAAEGERGFEETAAAVEDLDGGGQEEIQLRNHGDLPPKEHPSRILCDLERMEESDTIIEVGDGAVQPIRRSFSMDFSHRGRVSIADVLQTSMEDELLAAKDHGFLVGIGSSRRCGGEHCRTRVLPRVMSPVPMKRSFSSERFCFTRHGRGSSSILPV